MLITMSVEATEKEINHVVERIVEYGYKAHVLPGIEQIIIGAVGGSDRKGELENLRAAPGVEKVIQIVQPYKLAHHLMNPSGTVINIRHVRLGGNEVVVIAGPCSVESREQLFETARAVKAAGATMLRGGAYKPRTSPYEFQGLGLEALELLREASAETGLPVVTEVMSTDDVDLVGEYADMFQVGARNMQNFALLRRLSKTTTPILLKRGPSATIKEWLLAAEYILAGGNPNVALCERGIKTFETELRNTLDLSAAALAKELSHLPVVVDPSHGTGRASIIPAMSRAAVAMGVDGLIIEVHSCPERALSDGPQSLTPDIFKKLMEDLYTPARRVAAFA